MLAEISVFPLDKGSKGLSRFVAQSINIIELFVKYLLKLQTNRYMIIFGTQVFLLL